MIFLSKITITINVYNHRLLLSFNARNILLYQSGRDYDIMLWDTFKSICCCVKETHLRAFVGATIPMRKGVTTILG